MSDSNATDLRLYCICGQKMKITSNMLGKPGKCVACRQKIRIPAREELPDGIDILYLKDHPEWIRKSGDAVIALPDVVPPNAPAEEEDLILTGDPDDPAALPLLLFEPLGRLCNYEAKVDTQLEALKAGRPAQFDKTTLLGYRALARKARQHLEKRLRDELATIAAEVQALRETLTAENAALSSGARDYLEYSKRVLPHRKRREVLAYRQQNLRGWLATKDPHMAGGQLDVSLADVPVENLEAPFPLPRDLDALPIEHAVLKLEEALRQRERADRKLNELHRAHLNGDVSAEAMPGMRADTDAERERARTAVAFYRTRLQQVIQDCEEDSMAIQAHIGVRRRQLETAQLAKDAFEVLEEAAFRAQVDIKRARNLATRAVNANTVSDVPNPRGTFLERLARPGSQRGLGVDSWLGWIASALLLTVIFVPLGDDVPGGNPAIFQGLTLGLFVGAAFFGLAATLGARAPRALALNALWFMLTVAGAAYFQFESESVGPAGASLRGGPPWWTSLGGVLLLCGWGVGAIAAIVSFAALPGLRWAGVPVVVLGTLLAGIVHMDYAGFLVPEPSMDPVTLEPEPESGLYTAAIDISNTGRRPFWIGGDPIGVPRPSAYRVELRGADGTWVDAGPPAGAQAGEARLGNNLAAGLTVRPGDTVTVFHALPPGDYRVVLEPAWAGGRARERTFQMEPFAVSLEEFFPAEPQEDPNAQRGSGVTVELRGVVDGEASQPKFSFIVRQPNGQEIREQYLIGDPIHDVWVISEFNPSHNTVTISDGQRIIIVERGKPEELPR